MKQWQANREDADRKFQERQAKHAEKLHRQYQSLTIIALLLAFIIGLAIANTLQ
jgi:hypothetical protein